MGNNVGNNFLNIITNSKDHLVKWLEQLEKESFDKQPDAIKGLFAPTGEVNKDYFDNTCTSNQKANLGAQLDTLKVEAGKREAEMEDLQKQIDAIQDEIDDCTKEVLRLMTGVEQASLQLQEDEEDRVKGIVEDVIEEVAAGITGRDKARHEILIRIGDKIPGAYLVTQKLAQLTDMQDEVDKLVGDATDLVRNKNILEKRFSATKTVHDLLAATIEKIGTTDKTISNNDYDKSKPFYSPQKVEVYKDFIGVQKPATNIAYVPDSKEPVKKTEDDIIATYKNLFNGEQTGEHYSSSSKAVQNLGEALNFNKDGTGIIEDLAAAGFSQFDAARFIAENFRTAMLSINDDGKFSIPYGHDDEGVEIYDELTNKINNYTPMYSGFRGPLNTWDKDAGNTISTNPQIDSLSQNYADVINAMKNGGFTFKEAMFAMFDHKTGIFKDAGIEYDYTAQEEGLNYTINYAGDDATAEMYEKMSDMIYEAWGVKPSNIDGANIETTRIETKRTDPIWFELNGQENTKFSFVIDRNQDGKFDDTGEFVGAKEGTSWLDDLRSLDGSVDGVKDGKLSGDELKALKVLGTTFTDSVNKSGTDKNEFVPNKQEGNKDYDRQNDTTIAYTLQNAFSMGIEEIDLNGLESQVDKIDGGLDVNGNQAYSDTFSFKLNGETVDAHRLDESDEYMQKAYVIDKSFEVGLGEQKVDNTIKANYSEFEEFNKEFAKFEDKVSVLENFDIIKAEAHGSYIDAERNIEDFRSVEVEKGHNKAKSMKNIYSWDGVSSEVYTIASKEGIILDGDAKAQLEGIFIRNAGASAQDVVDMYKQLRADEQAYYDEKETRKEVFDIFNKIISEGHRVTTDEIEEKLKEGKTKDQILEECLGKKEE